MAELPKHYYVDESDPDIAVLRQDDGTFVAAFSARGANKEGLIEAAQEDYWSLKQQSTQASDLNRRWASSSDWEQSECPRAC